MQAPEFWTRDGACARLLGPLGWFQTTSVARKAHCAKPWRAKAKVICVGNLTLGGSGKTPVAIAIAEILQARGRRPCFLTRGYGGRIHGPHRVMPGDDARAVGDEALLLARTAPTIVARDRRAGAMEAERLGADVIVMDDGHQNFALAKDLSILVLGGLGNGRVFPAGPLRETVEQGLARADAVIVMEPDGDAPCPFQGPVLRARLEADAPELRGTRVFAFAGIGRPEKFVASLRESGAMIAGTRFFGDHHFYSAREIAALRARADGALLVTTEKDLARLAPGEAGEIASLKVRVRFADTDAPGRLLDRLGPAV